MTVARSVAEPVAKSVAQSVIAAGNDYSQTITVASNDGFETSLNVWQNAGNFGGGIIGNQNLLDTPGITCYHFTGLPYAEGEFVYRATFRAYAFSVVETSGAFSGRIRAELSTSSTPPSGSNLPSNFTTFTSNSRPLTAADFTAGQYNDCDVTDIVNEVIGQSGWTAGGNINFVFEDTGSASPDSRVVILLAEAALNQPAQLVIVG